jgi:hypothetical protein
MPATGACYVIAADSALSDDAHHVFDFVVPERGFEPRTY